MNEVFELLMLGKISQISSALQIEIHTKCVSCHNSWTRPKLCIPEHISNCLQALDAPQRLIKISDGAS